MAEESEGKVGKKSTKERVDALQIQVAKLEERVDLLMKILYAVIGALAALLVKIIFYQG